MSHIFYHLIISDTKIISLDDQQAFTVEKVQSSYHNLLHNVLISRAKPY